MAPSRNICVAVGVAAVSLGLQGCESSNLCKQSIPLLGPLICNHLAAVGPGGCSSLSGAHQATADDVAECQNKCAERDGCRYYTFCTDPSDCSLLYHGACGLISNDECELATSLARDDLTTFQMYDANIHTPHSQTKERSIGFMAGIAVAGTFTMVMARVGRRNTQDMRFIESGNGEE